MQAFSQETTAELQAALQLHQAGRLAQADAGYRRILARFPDHPDALNLAGYLAHQMGDQERARRLIERSIALAPRNPNFISNLAKVQLVQGRLEDAAASYRLSISLNPSDPQAHYNLALVMEGLGRPDEAEACYRRCLQLKPSETRAITNLGRLLQRQGRLDEAVACYRRVLAIDARDAAARNNLAGLLLQENRLQEAERVIRQALALNARDPGALRNMAALLARSGQLDESMACYRRALSIAPRDAETLDRLGRLLLLRGGCAQAAKCFERALEIEPGRAETLCYLALALKEQGKMAESAAACERALQSAPDLALAHSGLALIRKDQGRTDEALRHFDRLLELAPESLLFESNRLMTMIYSEACSPLQIAEASRRWGARFTAVTAANRGGYANRPDPERRLRIGYASPDLRRHSVSCFFAPLLAAHDRERFEITCYAEVPSPDQVTERLQGLADRWRDTVGREDGEIAAQVRADEIDILVDLAGHTALSRLPAFAYKPAPIQVTWLGYPSTTGLEAMDYRLTDDIADPPGESDRLSSETLVRLDDGFLCYEAPADAPAVAPPPFLEQGHVTFGSFNNLSKVTPQVVALWARLLQAVPDARLILKSMPLADAETQRHVRDLFAQHGIAGERIDLLSFITTTDGHLGAYGCLDIALDTLPYNGTTTTFEALWMGVPVVTLRADRHAGRVGASILTRLGLQDLIGESPDAYLSIAAALAADRDRLQQLRAGLRDRLARSPLCDAQGFAARIEGAYREMWRGWCEQQASSRG